MAVVDDDERAAAAGMLSVARNSGAALAPLFTGAILASPAMGLPFLLAGGLKVIYDLWIFASEAARGRTGAPLNYVSTRIL
jgi:hypothetical protein